MKTMNKQIENTLNYRGFTINHQKKTITTRIYAVSFTIQVHLNYDEFDRITVYDAAEITDFFPTIDKTLKGLKKDYEPIDKSEVNFDAFPRSMRDKMRKSSSWIIEVNAIKLQVQEINYLLSTDFKEIAEKTITSEKFAKFLEEIDIRTDNVMKISSKYTPNKFMWCTDGYLLEAVGEYLKDLVDRKIIYLEGFEVWDEFFALTLGSMFGDK